MSLLALVEFPTMQLSSQSIGNTEGLSLA